MARPVSVGTSEQRVEAYKKLAENLAMLAWYAVAVMGLGGQVRFFCQDETRLGLKTISGRKITAKGIKPCRGSSRQLTCMALLNQQRET